MQFKNKPKVAVFMVTYNHAQYIAQAIEGVMMQETSFPVKLIIGEDCSTDETRNICLQYKKKFPDKIDLILQENNIGANLNAKNVYQKCFEYGDYIAFCEGDDYWTDSLKLQKQVDVLENESDVLICFHETLVKYEGESEKNHLFTDKGITLKKYFDLQDFLKHDWIMATASVVFRKPTPFNIPSFYYKCHSADTCLFFILLKDGGKVKMLSDTMSVYRKHADGISNQCNHLDHYYNKLMMYSYLDEFYNFSNTKGFNRKIADQHFWLAIYYYYYRNNSHEMKIVRRYILKSINQDWRLFNRHTILLYLKTFLYFTQKYL